jgi:hypothetical protein
VAAPRAREIAEYLLKQPSLFSGDDGPSPQASPGKDQRAA